MKNCQKPLAKISSFHIHLRRFLIIGTRQRARICVIVVFVVFVGVLNMVVFDAVSVVIAVVIVFVAIVITDSKDIF